MRASTPTDVAGVLGQSRECGRAADIGPQGAMFPAAVARFMTLTTYVNESLNRVVTCCHDRRRLCAISDARSLRRRVAAHGLCAG